MNIYTLQTNMVYIYILQPTFTNYIQFVSEDKETTLQMAMEQSLNDREHDDFHQWNGAPSLPSQPKGRVCNIYFTCVLTCVDWYVDYALFFWGWLQRRWPRTSWFHVAEKWWGKPSRSVGIFHHLSHESGWNIEVNIPPVSADHTSDWCWNREDSIIT